ncbi:MAG TPA: hypothetical protein DIT89_01400 [Planctomycetaceae bacterium]|nr:hypothetical protein [Planctomycetaceae bacterium]
MELQFRPSSPLGGTPSVTAFGKSVRYFALNPFFVQPAEPCRWLWCPDSGVEGVIGFSRSHCDATS